MSAGAAPGPASIRRNAVLAFGAQLSTGLFTAALTLYLVRELGPTGFGLFSIALSIGALVILPADFGLAQSAARFLAERRGDRAAMERVVGDALLVKLVVASVIGALLFALSGPIASAYDLPGLVWPLRGIAVAVVAQSTFGLFRACFEAMGRMGTDWKLVAGESAVEASASIALVALGAGAAGAAWGRAIGYGFGLLLGAALMLRLLGLTLLRPRRPDPAFVRRLTGYGLALLIIDGVYAAFAEIDLLLLGAILGADATGVYAAPLRIVALLLYPAAAITAGVAPRMARQGGEAPNLAALERGLGLLLVTHLLLVTPLFVWAGPLVELAFGPGYEQAADVLRVLVPFILLAGPARLLSTSVNYLGEARRRIAIVIAALLLNIALDLLLIPRLGVVGAAIGNDVAFALYALGHVYVCSQIVGLRVAPLARSLGRGLVAAGAMGAVLLAIGGADAGAPMMAVGLVAGTGAFAATLLVLREPLAAELSEGVAAFARRRPRSPGGGSR